MSMMSALRSVAKAFNSFAESKYFFGVFAIVVNLVYAKVLSPMTEKVESYF